MIITLLCPLVSPQANPVFPPTYTQSSFTDVLLPRVDHSHFEEDPVAQRALLELMYNKLCVEHAGSPPRTRELFLNLDSKVGMHGVYMLHQVIESGSLAAIGNRGLRPAPVMGWSVERG
jgi:hypothetical protein